MLVQLLVLFVLESKSHSIYLEMFWGFPPQIHTEGGKKENTKPTGTFELTHDLSSVFYIRSFIKSVKMRYPEQL